MATLPIINRTRIAMELIRTPEVTTLANYADDQVDYSVGATATKYAAAAWFHNRGEAADPDNPTNEEMALNWINVVRQFNRNLLIASRVPAAGSTARSAEQAIVNAEADVDLGTDE